MRVTQQAQDLLLNIDLVAVTKGVAAAPANTLTITVTNAVRGGPVANQVVTADLYGVPPDTATLTSVTGSPALASIGGELANTPGTGIATTGATRVLGVTGADGVLVITAAVAAGLTAKTIVRAAAGQSYVSWALAA